MLANKCFILLCTVIAFGSCAYVDTIQKCSVKDFECHKATFQNFFKGYSKSGVPELNIPPFDPVVLKDTSVSILNQVELSILDGTLKGLKNCVVNDFRPNFEKGKATLDITCDLTVKGHYTAFSNSSLIKSLLGGESIHGDGRVKVKIDKLNIKVDFNFGIVSQNGELYIKCKDEKLKYKYDVLGRLSIAADNLYLGEQESSALITNMLNENWRQVMQTAGSTFIDRGMDVVKRMLKNFFDNVSIKHLIIEDMTPYVTN